MIVHEKQDKPVFAYCPNCWIHTYHIDEPGGRRCLNCHTLRDIKTTYSINTNKETNSQIQQSH
jgi:hypothetical protein